MTCGRGGTGRRAALRSLWPKGRGSSSLLDRTSIKGEGVLRLRRRSAACVNPDLRAGGGRLGDRGHYRQRPHRDCSKADDRLVAAELEMDAEIGHDLGCDRRRLGDSHGIDAIGYELEQEEAVEVAARDRHHL